MARQTVGSRSPRAVALYGANAVQVGPISLHGHGEVGLSEYVLLVLLVATKL